MKFSYNQAKKYITDKDLVVTTHIKTMLNRTAAMFEWFNIPENIPVNELEKLLQINGHCAFINFNDKYYVLSGNFSGEYDEYYRSKFYTIVNESLKISKTYEIDKDCIIISNDYQQQGLLPIFMKYSVLLADSELSLNTISVLSRITMLISAPDNKSKASADLFIKKILDGELSVIADNPFFEGIKLQSNSGNLASQHITDLIQLQQYYRAVEFNEIGLNAQFNLKREHINSDEIALNTDALIPLNENMLNERKLACEKINKMFNLELNVDFSSIWKATSKHLESEIKSVNNIKNQGAENEIGNENNGNEYRNENDRTFDEYENNEENENYRKNDENKDKK